MIIKKQQDVTEAVLRELDRAKNPRFKEIMGGAVRHLHAFAREAKLTEAELLDLNGSAHGWLCIEECSFSTGAVFDLSGGRATYEIEQARSDRVHHCSFRSEAEIQTETHLQSLCLT